MRNAFVGLVAFGAAVWLCLFPLVFAVTGIVLLVAASQGMELLDWTLHHAQRESHGYFFGGSVLVWAAATWYSARVLLERRFDLLSDHPSLAALKRYALRLGNWEPHILALLVYPPLAAYFVRNGHAWHGLMVAATGAGWLTFTLKRGDGPEVDGAVDEQSTNLGTTTILVLLAALSVLHALLVTLVCSDAALPRFTGAAPAVLLAFASWALVASLVLAALPEGDRQRWFTI
jgi:hypothetical protein